ncbi:MAG TPA: DUF296 domain-containing protein [Gammaproteobacteria bacterium]
MTSRIPVCMTSRIPVAALAFAVLAAGLPAAECAAQNDANAEYFALGENEPEPGLAPGLAVTDLGRVGRVAEVRLAPGDEVLSGLLEFVESERPANAVVTGIGGFESAVFAWYDPERRAFKRIPLDMKSEVVAFTGALSYQDGTPRVHVHAVVSLSDGTTRAGHLVSAIVAPIMQIFVLETVAED